MMRLILLITFCLSSLSAYAVTGEAIILGGKDLCTHITPEKSQAEILEYILESQTEDLRSIVKINDHFERYNIEERIKIVGCEVIRKHIPFWRMGTYKVTLEFSEKEELCRSDYKDYSIYSRIHNFDPEWDRLDRVTLKPLLILKPIGIRWTRGFTVNIDVCLFKDQDKILKLIRERY